MVTSRLYSQGERKEEREGRVSVHSPRHLAYVAIYTCLLMFTIESIDCLLCPTIVGQCALPFM